jgi:hypothetical protein
MIDSSDDDNDHDFRRKPVGRMTSGQLRQWDGFHDTVSSLVKIAMPDHIHQVSILLKQFDGREAELIQTLQTMCRRKESSTIPCNYNNTTKQSKIHHSRGAISTVAKDSIRRTSTMIGRKIDAIARIAAASTLDDQTKAVKPEFVIDHNNENQYDPSHHSHNHNHSNDDDEDDDDDQSFWKSKISLALSFDSQDDDDDEEEEEDNDEDFKHNHHHRRHHQHHHRPQDEDPSQIYSDEDDDESYHENEGDTYYDYDDDEEEEEEEENESNMYTDNEEEEDDNDDDDDVSEGSSASWEEKYGNSTYGNDQWR